MLFSRTIIATVLLALVTGPAIAGSKKTICHNGQTITISKNALKAHLKHGDTKGACPAPPAPPPPIYNAVVMMRCLNNNGELVVSGVSQSGNVTINPLITPREPCADAVADMLNGGYKLEQVSTGLTDGEIEYLFLGHSRTQ